MSSRRIMNITRIIYTAVIISKHSRPIMMTALASNMLPKNKFDIPAIERLKTIPPLEVKPLLPELMEWIGDINWPIAGAVIDFLLNHVPPADLVPRIHEIFTKNDDVELSHNCLLYLVASMKRDDVISLRHDLERIVNFPTKENTEDYELPDEASGILKAWDDHSIPKES